MDNNVKEYDSINKRSHRLRIVGLILFVASIAFGLVFSNWQVDKIVMQQKHIKERDSTLTIIMDANVKLASKKDSLELIVNKFFRLFNTHDVDSLDYLYADTLKSYFKNFHNVSKEIVKKSSKQYWTKFPDSRCEIGTINLFLDSLSDKCIVKAQDYIDSSSKSLDVIIELHFDKNKRINYVREFYGGK